LGELAREFEFNYATARPNPYATFTLYVPVGDTMIEAVCKRRRKRVLLEAIEAATRTYPTTGGDPAVRVFGNVLAGEIYGKFILSVTVSNHVAEGGFSALKEPSPSAVIAVAREWILNTGGFETLPGIEEATARRVQEEMAPDAAAKSDEVAG
jgi:hypothetical protein